MSLQETLSQKSGDDYYRWGVEKQTFPTLLLEQIWERNVAFAWTQIIAIIRLRGEDEQIRIVNARQRRAAGTVVVLCDTKYATLAALDKHMELAHTGNGGLAELPRRVFSSSGSRAFSSCPGPGGARRSTAL